MSSYSNTGLELIGSGQQAGSWGTTTNTNLQIIDKMISQKETITLSGTTQTLTVADGVLSSTDRKAAYLKFNGAPGGNCTVTIDPDDMERIYIVENAVTDGYGVIINQGSGTGDTVSIAPGAISMVYLPGDGVDSDVVRITSYSAGIDNSFYIQAGDMWPVLAQQPGGDHTLTDSNTDTHDDELEPNIKDASTSSLSRSIRSWDFDAASSEFVCFEHVMPPDWDGGTLTFEPVWSPSTGTSGAVRWRIQAVAMQNAYDWDVSDWSSDYAVVLTTATASLVVHRGTQSASPDGLFTAGTPANAGDIVLFSLHRDASNTADTMTGDAMLHGIFIYYNSATACTC